MKSWSSPKALVVGLALSLFALAAGLGMAKLFDDRPGAGRAEAGASLPPGFVAPQPYHIPPERLGEWLRVSTDFEKDLIRDGTLTFEEYQQAVLRTVSCIERAGLDVVHSTGYGRSEEMVTGPRLSKRGVYSYTARIFSPDGSRPEAEFAAVNECRAGSAQVEFLWAQHTAPSEVELQALRDHMAACLRENGSGVAERPSDEELRRAVGSVPHEIYRGCQFKAADALEIDRVPG